MAKKLLLSGLIVLFLAIGSTLLAKSAQARDLRAVKLEKFFGKYDSPLKDEADTFVAEADRNNLDYKLLPAISGVESTFAQQYIKGTNNVWGWGGGEIYFKDWKEAIAKISKGLKENYADKGAKEVGQIAFIYCPPNSYHWAAGVGQFMDEIEKVPVKDQATADLHLTL